MLQNNGFRRRALVGSPFTRDGIDVVSVISLSGIYERESFYRDVLGITFLDMRDVSGTNCMCDDVAKELLLDRIGNGCGTSAVRAAFDGGSVDERSRMQDNANGILPYGLHFIDNGNYHYLSALYLSMVKEPFSLVVLDHHPDMQRPMFDILSCGGWVLEVLEKNQFVRDVHIIGADRKLIEELDPADREKVKFYDVDEIFGGVGFDAGEVRGIGNVCGAGVSGICLPDTNYPVYLSIDKDVIRRSELTTNWDQGEMAASQVLGLAKALLHGTKSGSVGCDCKDDGRETVGRDGSVYRTESDDATGQAEKKHVTGRADSDIRLLGIDVCGECAPDQEDCDLEKAIASNDEFNRKILELFKSPD